MKSLYFLAIITAACWASSGARARSCDADTSATVASRTRGVDGNGLGLEGRLNHDDATYKIGQSLVLIVSARKDTLVELWQADADNRLTRVIAEASLIPGGKTISLPDGEKVLHVRGPEGLNELVLIGRARNLGNSRGLMDAENDLVGDEVQQELHICFRVVR